MCVMSVPILHVKLKNLLPGSGVYILFSAFFHFAIFQIKQLCLEGGLYAFLENYFATPCGFYSGADKCESKILNWWNNKICNC